MLYCCSSCCWMGFLSVIALPFLVASLCEAALDSERFLCVKSFPIAYLRPPECEYRRILHVCRPSAEKTAKRSAKFWNLILEPIRSVALQ